MKSNNYIVLIKNECKSNTVQGTHFKWKCSMSSKKILEKDSWLFFENKWLRRPEKWFFLKISDCGDFNKNPWFFRDKWSWRIVEFNGDTKKHYCFLFDLFEKFKESEETLFFLVCLGCFSFFINYWRYHLRINFSISFLVHDTLLYCAHYHGERDQTYWGSLCLSPFSWKMDIAWYFLFIGVNTLSHMVVRGLVRS